MRKLPDGYDTMLGRWFPQGQELSADEWQRIVDGDPDTGMMAAVTTRWIGAHTGRASALTVHGP